MSKEIIKESSNKKRDDIIRTTISKELEEIFNLIKEDIINYAWDTSIKISDVQASKILVEKIKNSNIKLKRPLAGK